MASTFTTCVDRGTWDFLFFLKKNKKNQYMFYKHYNALEEKKIGIIKVEKLHVGDKY